MHATAAGQSYAAARREVIQELRSARPGPDLNLGRHLARWRPGRRDIGRQPAGQVRLGTLREGGFSVAQAHQALHLLGSRVLGFTRELFGDPADAAPAAEPSLPAGFVAAFPYAAEMAVAVSHGGALGRCDDDGEFEFALDFILDGLSRLPRPPAEK